MRKTFLGFILLIILVVTSASSGLAHHRGAVLGENVAPSDINFPPVTGGPGLVLPDSPLFFLDQTKQALRLSLALTPETKAKVHLEIAGERLAELRIMTKRGNTDGIATSLSGLGQEVSGASDSIAEAVARGRNVEKAAKDLNDALKVHRDTLAAVEAQAGGNLKAQVRATRLTVVLAKTQIEDALPQDLLSQEAKEDARVELLHELEVAQDAIIRAGSLSKQSEDTKVAASSIQRLEQGVKAALDSIKNSQSVAGVATESAQ